VRYFPPGTSMKASFLCAFVLLTAACSASPDGAATKRSQQPAPPASAPTPASASAPIAPAVVAPGTRVPDAVLRACDLVAEIATRSKGVTITRTVGQFDDEHEGRTRVGCSVSLVGSNVALGASPNPIERLREEFAARGWQEELNHSADGPDGTQFAYVRDGIICIFEGRWDGGDDTDLSYKPDDAYKGAGHCAAGLPWQD